MAKTPTLPAKQRGGLFSLLGVANKKSWESKNLADVDDITLEKSFSYGLPSTTIATLIGNTPGGVRTRQQIYQDWLTMGQDSICSSSIKLMTTTAMGGHDTTGDIVFIEKKPEIQNNSKLTSLVEEIAKDLGPLLNRHIYATAYTGAQFGDSYARLYTQDKKGVIQINTDEMIHPSLVQPYERGGETVGYAVFVGNENFERLNVAQLARLKMPRIQFIPQYGVVEKAMRTVLTEDDLSQLTIMPSMAGGSLLYPAEKPYHNMNTALLALIAQRTNVSLDHRIVGVQMANMTKEQQDRFGASVVAMFRKVKETIAEAIKTGKPIAESIVSILPMNSEKQLVNLSQGNTATQTITVEDVLLHARLLAGALGTDLSNLGFLDQVSGWMGDSGISRTSAQSAENSRIIRTGAAGFCNHVIDIHTLTKYGVVFPENERPWSVNFYGSIAALEAERQKTNNDKMNASLILVQAMQQFKDMGASQEMMESFLSRNLMLEEAQAKLFAQIVNLQASQGGMGNEPLQ